MTRTRKETMAAFHCLGPNLDDRIRSNVAEARIYSVLGDTLLTRLPSREVGVGVDERETAEAYCA